MGQAREVLVVGAGAAGSAAAIALHEQVDASADVTVTVVGAEERLPYNRTTVNKGLLSGAVDDAAVALPGVASTSATWRTGAIARSLTVGERVVHLSHGERLVADAVVLATGATPRRLPAPVEDAALRRVLTLRSADDTHQLRALVARARRRPPRVVIAGAGLIGTEVAAILQEVGCEVTLVEAGGQPMASHVGAGVAAWVSAAHLAASVDLRLDTRITGVRSGDAGVAVDLSDGDALAAVAVLVCLGVEPATHWLAGSALPVAADGSAPGGLLVDDGQRVAGVPGVYAAGDLAAVPGPDGAPVRVEHWGAALDQGRRAAASVLSDLGLTADRPQARALPSYSTYVHSTKLTILGWPTSTVAERPVLGRPGDPRFAVALLDADDRIVGAVGVGGARAVNAIRPLIERRAPVGELEPSRPAGATPSGP